MKRDDVEPIIDVAPERSASNFLIQIAVRGGQNPNIDLPNLCRTNGDDLALLQSPEEPDLGRRGHFSNLVKKKGAPVGRLEEPNLVLDGTCKRSLHMPEELALEQPLGKRPTQFKEKKLLSARPLSPWM